MKSKLFTKTAQNLAEYAIVFALVIGVFTAMQVYVKRGVQGVLKKTADDLGPQEYETDDENSGKIKSSDYSRVTREGGAANNRTTVTKTAAGRRSDRVKQGTTTTDMYSVQSTYIFKD